MNPLLLTKKPLPTVFFDLDDIEHIVLKRSMKKNSKWQEKLLCYSHLPQLIVGEFRAISLATNTFVCSELDRHYLRKWFHRKSVAVIPNAISIPEKYPLNREPTLLFIGSYGYKPNMEAAEFLLQKIFPRLVKIISKLHLIIAGANPENIRGYKPDIPGVTFTGFVDDLDSLYRRTKIVCAPIFTGGGTRVKIIEAAAYAKPIIATRIGAEGIEFRNGQEILIRDNEESFIEGSPGHRRSGHWFPF
jgi:glycosyltransferase involved in cell wall biosynthesis